MSEKKIKRAQEVKWDELENEKGNAREQHRNEGGRKSMSKAGTRKGRAGRIRGMEI